MDQSTIKDLPGENASTACEYYRVFRCSPKSEAPRYKKDVIPLDPRLDTLRFGSLDDNRFDAISSLITDKNSKTSEVGQWIVSGLSLAEGEEAFRLLVHFYPASNSEVRYLAKSEGGNGSTEIPVLPTCREYYRMVRRSLGPEVHIYEKHFIPMGPDPHADISYIDALDMINKYQFDAISSLFAEKNSGTAEEGQWVLTGLRFIKGDEALRLSIHFYPDFQGDSPVDSGKTGLAGRQPGVGAIEGETNGHDIGEGVNMQDDHYAMGDYLDPTQIMLREFFLN